MDEYKSLDNGGRLPGNFNRPAEVEQSIAGRELDIPVDSWDAYKSWCEKVRDNWDEDDSDEWCG